MSNQLDSHNLNEQWIAFINTKIIAIDYYF